MVREKIYKFIFYTHFVPSICKRAFYTSIYLFSLAPLPLQSNHIRWSELEAKRSFRLHIALWSNASRKPWYVIYHIRSSSQGWKILCDRHRVMPSQSPSTYYKRNVVVCVGMHASLPCTPRCKPNKHTALVCNQVYVASSFHSSFSPVNVSA